MGVTGAARGVRRRTVGAALVVLMAVALLPLATSQPAFAGPVAADDTTYALCGRAFPDPQAFGPSPASAPTESPWAKGNAVCRATSFISHSDALAGLTYLADRDDTGPFIEVINLAETDDPDIRAVLDAELGEGYSSGLPQIDGSRDVQPLHVIKVTAPDGAVLVDGVTPTPEADRAHFVFPLSIHGIERAGIEGGLRAIEDLATWGALEPTRRLLETYDSDTITTFGGNEVRNLPVGEVLMGSVSYFVLANPDGWRRGTDQVAEDLPVDIPVSFQRYNGNGMDMNRDWPAIGYTEHAYTPWSEPETRSFGEALQAISDQWSGGIDLHGQLIAGAYSYTLIGGSQRPYGKNERVQQFVEEAYADAEIRLAWSSLIKPNDSGADDPRLYGVQYGTIWDTLEYTVTGAFGDWIDSPIGLNADGIDNEMSLSHLGNCGTGTCYLPEFEQLHVDGNKSLIFGMLNFNLQPPDPSFDIGEGDVAYLVNPRRLVSGPVRYPEAPAGAVPNNDDITGTGQHAGVAGTTVLEQFDIVQDATTFTGGFSAQVTYQANLGANSPGALNGVHIERLVADGETVPGLDPGDWQRVESYFNQAPTYVQAGARVDENHPTTGTYRVVMDGPVPQAFSYQITFSTEPVWPEVGQDPYDVSNSDFFRDLKPFMADGSTLVAVDPRNVINGTRDLSDFDSVVAIDDAFLPGWLDEVGMLDAPAGRSAGGNIRDDLLVPNESGKNDLGDFGFTQADLDAMADAVDDFVRGGGNLVLTDDSLRALEWLDYVEAGAVHTKDTYANHVSFSVDDTETYGHPLAADIDRPGAAEGSNSRRQTSEPVPIGYCVDSDVCRTGETSMPQWYVDRPAWESAGGVALGGDGSDGASDSRTSFGEMVVGNGVVRILGGFQPFPTTEYDHQFGLSSYAVTDSGYVLLRNMLRWENAGQSPDPDLDDDPVTPVQVPGSNDLPDDMGGDPIVPEVVRYSGPGRVETAADVSANRFGPEEGRNVFVATAGNFPDALAGGPAAFLGNAPILLTGTDDLPAATRTEIERLDPETITILGGTAAVSEGVESELADLASVGVRRIGGADRFATAAMVAEAAFRGTGGTVYVSTGGDFPDTLAAGPAAGLAAAPVLLVDRDRLPEATAAQLERLAPSRIVVVGGTAVVSEDVAGQLAAYGPVERIAGSSRVGTSVAVSADAFDPVPGAVYIATGGNFPDGLAGAPAAAFEGAPILLVGQDLPDEVAEEILRLGVHRVVILGGTAAVPAAVEQALEDLLAEAFSTDGESSRD